jgi:hypothetical protein
VRYYQGVRAYLVVHATNAVFPRAAEQRVEAMQRARYVAPVVKMVRIVDIREMQFPDT